MIKEEELLFAEEPSLTTAKMLKPWKIVIADDDEEVHAVTRMVLDGFVFEGQGLELLGAYSGAETKRLLKEHPDTALVLLDVVMEEDTTGLEVVKYIREVLQNRFVRIIMRTGQPGQAPERRVTIEYDINDYKEKTELTAQKLFTAVIASLRAYRDLKIIEKNRQGLTHIVSASTHLFELRTLKQFVTSALAQLVSLLDLRENGYLVSSSGLALKRDKHSYKVLAGIGEFTNYESWATHQDIMNSELTPFFNYVVETRQSLFSENAYIGYFKTRRDAEYLLYLQNQHGFSEIEADLIKMFAANIAVAFDNLSLNEEIEETQKEAIYTLGEAVESRSEEAGFHVKRVGDFCYLLAQKYGLDQETAKLIRMAAPMHDVGKIGIPDAILNKPGKLTPEEFEIIKTHTTIGYDILKGSKQKILTTAAIIALEHHERWDGFGYPTGLKGEQINILARITKVADVFDALSCKRVYKDAWELNQVLELFREDRGSHFEPTLVSLLLNNLNDFLEVSHIHYNEKNEV
ncbi:two-component response receiver and regulator protein [Candidatus Vecturithrix granuli]|uniref:Two-component response receiver and regulator protein n=1 Tax=Vecturithrix granuli TaxID=1499967 RepID=A0A081BZR0_VECG1|nr:two-component response receiver and regulator protein [Candidatus Vecturithrix granuli]